jgi:LacI family transcriptional regulator
VTASTNSRTASRETARANNKAGAFRIALLFNGNKSFDREILAGIAAYLETTRVAWDLFLEEDFQLRLAEIGQWQGDGIIADFDDPAVAQALAGSPLPVVAVGGSYANPADYPRGIPYVATENDKLVKLARNHLIDTGLQRFAMFSLPATAQNRWAREREQAFRRLMAHDGMAADVFHGCETSASAWDDAVQGQVAWLRSLPKPVGIIGVTDARARQLLQACALAGIAVPEEVALIGIDNDPLVRALSRIPLSSVIQGTHEMGRTAAHLLSQMLSGGRLPDTRILVPPAGIEVGGSSQHAVIRHPRVMRACHFIRRFACRGIKTSQVAEYVGTSRSSLEANFRTELGCSVHDEILRSRLDAARAALACPQRTIAEVALACGFVTAQYMHLVFKRELGCTPRAYREQLQCEHAAA